MVGFFGMGPVVWSILWLVLFVMWANVVVYLVVRDRSMRESQRNAIEQQADVLRRYVWSVSAPPSPAEELAHLAELRDRGVIDAEDFAVLKARVLH